MKVALVYDRVNKWGGAERVLLALHELFPNAPLFTSVYNPHNARWARKFTVRSSFLQRFPLAKSAHELYALLMPLAFERFSFEGYDLVISVTSEAAKGVITGPHTKHICYCLTPTRYLWSGYDEYFGDGLLRSIASPAVEYLRRWDLVASERPDDMIAISDEVRKRIKKYYGRDASVIYPPVALPETPVYKNSRPRPAEEPYFLVVSRLVPYKRIDIAIEACNRLRAPLKIIGTGAEMERLRRIAGPTVDFLGTLTDRELVRYYKNCTALLFPGKEDFGIAVLEAQGFGKPVVAYKGGGVVETVIDGKTGRFFAPQTPAALAKVLGEFNATRFSAENCIKQAEKFSKSRFKQQFLSFTEKIMHNRKAV